MPEKWFESRWGYFIRPYFTKGLCTTFRRRLTKVQKGALFVTLPVHSFLALVSDIAAFIIISTLELGK